MRLPHHCSDSLFVITNDVGTRISGLRSIGLKTPDADDSIFKEFHAGLVEHVSKMLPEVKVVTYDMAELVDEIWSQAIQLKTDLASAVVVSTCAELAVTRRGHIIEMNRLVDVNGDIIGFGPRPGTALLSKQVASIAALASGKSVVIAEDGAFSGSTIDFLVKQFAQRHVEVAAVVVGICFPAAVENLSKSFKGRLMVIEETEKPFEWMPDHDFLPFVPNCGRVLGTMFGDEGVPFYTHDGVSFCFPYVLPFGDPVKWASIPQQHAPRFSLFCLEQSLKIYSHLDKLNDRRLTIRDLSGSAPAVSMPMSRGKGRLPTIDMPVSDFLGEICHEF
ncbi:MAG: hypothetical protein M3Q73_03200 [bacterium]|nr:hypothetical protein [bacterium]